MFECIKIVFDRVSSFQMGCEKIECAILEYALSKGANASDCIENCENCLFVHGDQYFAGGSAKILETIIENVVLTSENISEEDMDRFINGNRIKCGQPTKNLLQLIEEVKLLNF